MDNYVAGIGNMPDVIFCTHKFPCVPLFGGSHDFDLSATGCCAGQIFLCNVFNMQIAINKTLGL